MFRANNLFIVAAWIGCLILTPTVEADEAEKIRAAAEKSVALLQRCGPEFFRQSGCYACHQQSVTSIAVGAARSRGLRVDEETARQQIKMTAIVIRGYRARLLQRVDHPFSQALTIGYTSLGLSAEGFPPDENTDAMVHEMSGRQTVEGSWTSYSHRPPLEYSKISSTALAVRTMQLYGPAGKKQEFSRRIDRARDWLIGATPVSNEGHAFRLMGLVWSGAEKKQLDGQIKTLIDQQRSDGGWSQFPNLDNDAYATGMNLYALHEAGIATTDPVYQQGVKYLLDTQLDDGSWHVRSRAFPVQKYFESGFPHGDDQWISAMATGWSATALMLTLPKVDKDRR